MIKRVGAKKYVVMDTTGKRPLSKPMPRGAATKRLQQINTYKPKPGVADA